MPKTLPHDVPMRHFCHEPQLVEQMVEVPTIVSFSSLQRTVEQNVDIPVVGGRWSWWRSFFSRTTAFFCDCRADRCQSSSLAVSWWKSSRFTPWREFNSVFGADPRVSRSRWRPTRFSASPEFRSIFFGFSWTRWARGFSDFSPGQKKSEGRPAGG